MIKTRIEHKMGIKNRFWFILNFCICLNFSLTAQLPKTEIWVADFKNIFTQPTLFSLSYLSAFNPNGYNNQPSFFDYNEIYISAAIDTSTKTDVYALNLRNNTFRQVTDTPLISEFSPLLHPNKREFSCVRIEEDGKDQSLWLYPENRINIGKRLLSHHENVGYHSWIGMQQLALFLVSEPNKLAISDVEKGETQILIDNIGRCLKTSEDNQVYFVHKVSNILWILKKYDTRQKVISTIVNMPFQIEDFEILPNGNLMTTRESKLLLFDLKKDSDWKVIYDFEPFGLTNIQRPAIFRDRVVFVNNKG